MNRNYPNLETRSIENGHLRLEFLTNAGPRLLRLSLACSQENVLAEAPNLGRSTPYGDYFFHGGHRLWYAPENFPRTYMPDNDAPTIHERRIVQD